MDTDQPLASQTPAALPNVTQIVSGFEQQLAQLRDWNQQVAQRLDAERQLLDEQKKQLDQERATLRDEQGQLDWHRGEFDSDKEAFQAEVQRVESLEAALTQQRQTLDEEAMALAGEREELCEAWSSVNRVQEAQGQLLDTLDTERQRIANIFQPSDDDIRAAA